MLRHGFGNDLGARPDAKRATNPLGPFVVQNLVAFLVDFRRSTLAYVPAWAPFPKSGW